MAKTEGERELDKRLDELFGDADFRWSVHSGGYQCEEHDYVPFGPANQPERREMMLTDRVLFGQERLIRRYSPLKEKALLPTFADLPFRDHDKLREFANKYGLLGIAVQAIFPPIKHKGPLPNLFKETRTGVRPATARDLKGRLPRPVGTGELISDWGMEIRAMVRAIRVRELVANRDVRTLNNYFLRRNNKWIFEERGEFRYGQVVEQKDLPLTEDDVLVAARVCVQRWVNEKLRTHVSPQILWDIPTSKHVFRFMPKNLLGALWVQFARTFVGEVTYRQCKVCSKVLTISSDQGCYRIDREFCSAACRQRDHRRKVREAIELNKRGKSVQQIAEHFDASIKTIKGWLKKVRAK